MNFCDEEFDVSDKKFLINLCSEDVLERSILTSFSFMHNALVKKDDQCKNKIKANHFIDKIVAMSFLN